MALICFNALSAISVSAIQTPRAAALILPRSVRFHWVWSCQRISGTDCADCAGRLRSIRSKQSVGSPSAFPFEYPLGVVAGVKGFGLYSRCLFNRKSIQCRRNKQLRISSMKAADFADDLNDFLSRYVYQPALTQRLDRLDDVDFVQSLIDEIVLWKVNRYVMLDDRLLRSIDDFKTLSAGEHRKAETVLQSLLQTHGVDLPMASTLLRFRNPRTFQIIDRHAYRGIYDETYSLYRASPVMRKIAVYFDYLDELLVLCKKRALDFQTIDRVLYVFDREKNGPL